MEVDAFMAAARAAQCNAQQCADLIGDDLLDGSNPRRRRQLLEHATDEDPSNDDTAVHVQLGSEAIHVAITGHGQIALHNTLMFQGEHVRLRVMDDKALRWMDDVAEVTVDLQPHPGDGACAPLSGSCTFIARAIGLQKRVSMWRVYQWARGLRSVGGWSVGYAISMPQAPAEAWLTRSVHGGEIAFGTSKHFPARVSASEHPAPPPVHLEWSGVRWMLAA